MCKFETLILVTTGICLINSILSTLSTIMKDVIMVFGTIEPHAYSRCLQVCPSLRVLRAIKSRQVNWLVIYYK